MLMDQVLTSPVTYSVKLTLDSRDLMLFTFENKDFQIS